MRLNTIPILLNFLLIDFKGGSTFGIFEKLPHVVGLVSNLDKPSALRALEAITAELETREKFLKKLDVPDILAYHKLIKQGDFPINWQPLPHLFIIVDEFAQMIHEMPDFLSKLVETARTGRSLGVHLILATQRPGGVVTDEMRANLNFRISLRVQTIDDSRDLLRRPDAAFLPPNLPGRAYFQLGDGGTPRQFQVARTGVHYETQIVEKKNEIKLYRLDYEEGSVRDLSTGEEPDDDSQKDTRETLARALVESLVELYTSQIKNGFEPMKPILLPPLPTEIGIDEITKTNGATWNEKASAWNLKDINEIGFNIPLGVIDNLSKRIQPPYILNFLEHGGHLMAVGGPQSGKTYFLQTLVYSLVTRYTPLQAQIYILSFAGGELEAVADLPHVGKVIHGSDTERLHRLIGFLQSEIELRKQKFSRSKAQGLFDYNFQSDVEQHLPYICVLIDNFGELKKPKFV